MTDKPTPPFAAHIERVDVYPRYYIVRRMHADPFTNQMRPLPISEFQRIVMVKEGATKLLTAIEEAIGEAPSPSTANKGS